MSAAAGRLESFMTVPSSTTVSATNDKGGPTSVTVPAGSYTPTTLCSGFAAALNLTRPNLAYPLTAAKTAAYIGYGTWSSGWLCNETSGNLAASFGSPTLTATSLTYSNAGPRYTLLGDTSDLAVGFDATSDKTDGGNTMEVTTGDLCVAWVGKFSATPSAYCNLFGRVTASFTAGWSVFVPVPTASVGFAVSAGTAVDTQASGLLIGEWHVGLAALDRSTGKIRVGILSLSTSSTALSAEVSASGNFTNPADVFRMGTSAWVPGPDTFQLAGFYIGNSATGLSANMATALSNFKQAINAGWTCTLSTGSSGTGQVTIDSTSPLTEADAYSISWTSTDLRDVLGHAGNITAATTATTGAAQAKGLWLPGCPLALDSDPKRAPKGTDHRATVSPRGAVFARVGNTMYRHRGLRYSHIVQAKAWEAEAAYVNAGFDTFYTDTQLGLGSISWFTPSSALVVYYDALGSDAVLGYDLNSGAGPTAGWKILTPVGLDEVAFAVDGWTGMVKIVLGDVVSTG